ncbi:hypothetical protein chiPu_0029533, partial [Chiloscyllium punctatum]|nr:hypothetical protein [Chiloscyllium punctatum]
MWWFGGVLFDDHKPRGCGRRARAESAGPNGAVRPGQGLVPGQGQSQGLSCWYEAEMERAKPAGDYGLRCAWREELYPAPAWEDPEGGAGTCRAAVSRVFRSKKFRSEKLERLYQRYFFRLNQSSLTMLMGVLVLVCGLMLTFHCVSGPPYVPYVCVLSLAGAIFLVLLLVCNRNSFPQDYMWLVSYLVLGILLCVQVLDSLAGGPRAPSPPTPQGLCWTVFFVYIAYTLLPIRMRAAVLSGIALCTLQTVLSCRREGREQPTWKQ